jgi:hypothetical protein
VKRIVLAALALGSPRWSAPALPALVARRARRARDRGEGTEIVGTRVRVDSVDIELAAGRGTIRGVRVANPEGYSDADAISLAEIELAIDARSLREQPFRDHARARRRSARELRAPRRRRLEHRADHPLASRLGRDGAGARGGEPRASRSASSTFAGGEIFLARPGAEATERVPDARTSS